MQVVRCRRINYYKSREVLFCLLLQVMSLSPSSNSRPQAQLHACTIRHDSLFKAVWDWIILALVIFTAIEIPFSVAFLMPLQKDIEEELEEKTKGDWSFLKVTPLLVFNLCVDLMFIIDIFINFRTTFIKLNTDEVISNPKQIALHYLKTWFVVDFVAAIPFEFMITTKVDSVSNNNLVPYLITAVIAVLILLSR